ncbi:MAG: GntR family transcriptional regulator [Sedimentisphaerales bacterium]|nr:GntR family transcriptional regulator [Sedimentisphaerales bacterium]
MSRFSRKPRYVEIMESIAEGIERGALPPGSKLPSERELCEQWGVSSITVRRAIQELVQKGLLVPRQGAGVFVMPPPTENKGLKGDVIGLVIPNSTGYHNGHLVQEIEIAARKRGYSVLIKHSSNDSEQERECVNLMVERNVAGMLIAPTTGDMRDLVITYAELLAKRVPFVFVDRYVPILDVPYVVADNEASGYAATKHLIEQGHQRIAYLGPLWSSASAARLDGYKKAINEAGLELEPKIIVTGIDFDEESLTRGVEKLLSQGDGLFTAVFADTDELARTTYRVLQHNGIVIPDDIALVGHDDAPYASVLTPSLTTVRLPYVEMAEAGVGLLVDSLLANRELQERKIILKSELIVRESSVRNSNKS